MSKGSPAGLQLFNTPLYLLKCWQKIACLQFGAGQVARRGVYLQEKKKNACCSWKLRLTRAEFMGQETKTVRGEAQLGASSL